MNNSNAALDSRINMRMTRADIESLEKLRRRLGARSGAEVLRGLLRKAAQEQAPKTCAACGSH